MRQTIQKADSASKNCIFQECIYFVLVLPIDNFDPNDKIGLNKANSQRILFRLFIEYWKPFHQSVGSTDNSFELPMIRPVLIKYQIYKYIMNIYIINIFYTDQSVGSTDNSCCPAYDQTNADDEDSGENWVPFLHFVN